jgi:ABC-type dipeptide/oligopeptide/nickel transport system permease component
VRLLRLILTRIAIAIPLLFIVSTLIFLLTHVLPGDVAGLLAGPDASPENIADIRDRLGLNDSLWVQYVNYLGGLLHGDFGLSFRTGRDVGEELFSRLAPTLLLVTFGMIAATVYGIALGSATVFSRWLRRPTRFLTSIGLSTPDFVLGVGLIFVFYFLLDWAPAPTGQIGFSVDDPPRVTGAALIDAILAGQWATASDALAHLVLPVITMALVYGASIAKVAEASFRESKAAPFMDYATLTSLRRTTRAKYLTVSSLPAIITYAGASFAYMLGGVVLIETVFSWGGMAQFAAGAIADRDLNVIQAFVLIVSVFTFVIYLLLDILYMIIDPRVRV